MMNRSLALALVAAVLVPALASAQQQPQGRFQTGAVTWTPTLSLREAGIDSNVYDEPTNPREDQSAVIAPEVDGIITMRSADVRFNGGVDFVYFHTYAAERSINSRGNVRADLRLSRIRPYATVAFLDARERVNSEIDVRARRSDQAFGGGIGIEISPRGVVELGASMSDSSFRQGETFMGVDLAQRLNRQGTGANLRFKYEVTPLTRFVTEAGASRDRFTQAPGFDTNNATISAGFEFEPDALLKGKARIGYHRIDAVGALASAYEGVTAAVELGYVLMQRTRFDVRVLRDTSYSFEAQPYFVQTVYGGEVLHTIVGPIDIFVRGSRETLDYPAVAERGLESGQLEVMRYGGGVALRPGPRVRMTINYEFTERLGHISADRRYDRRRLYTNVTYGF
jgi:hypothetical protein